MIITERTIINRANTSIVWPELSYTPVEDTNDPWPNANVAKIESISDDNLTKTITRTWTSLEEFITAHVYSGPNSRAYFGSIINPGITFTKVFSATE